MIRFFFLKSTQNFEIRRRVPRVKTNWRNSKTHTHTSLSLSTCRSSDAMFTWMCLHQSLSLYICKQCLDPDQTWMVFRIECFVNLKMCACDRKYAKRWYCGVSDFAVQKQMRTISLGFGSSLEAVVTRLIDSPKHCVNQAKTKDLCANNVQSLSLSTFMTCYQSLQTVWIQKIDRRTWSGSNKHAKSSNLVQFCVRWSPHAERNISDKCLLSDACQGRIQMGTGGLDPLKNHKKYRVS